MEKELPNIFKKHPFILPKNYFEGYEERLLGKVKVLASENRAKNPMTSPNSYFDNLENEVLLAIKAKKFESRKIGHPFATPKNYFENLETFVLGSLKSKEVKKTVFLTPMKAWKKFVFAAAAASVALIAGVFISQKFNPTVTIECNTSACLMDKVSAEEIKTELDDIELTDEELTDLISTKSLDELITSVKSTTSKKEPNTIQTNHKSKSEIENESVIPLMDEDLDTDFFDDI